MGFRFRRSLRVFPGLRLNLSKSGVSTSVGTRGAWLTFGARGTRATIGIPGTGLSYTEYASAGRSAPRPAVFGKLPSAQPVAAIALPAPAPIEPIAIDSVPPTLIALAGILALAVILAVVAGAVVFFR